MTIEIRGGENPTHIENVFYEVLCLNCDDISKENGDYLDRPLEIVGFEEQATLEKAKSEAEKHNAEYPNHKIIIRGFDTGLIQKALGL